ncbi:DUF1659 domain-containing protein [Desulfurispora thermophila]|uniref:DUF1659 domain-containing protein n=1 Tax=Desulfurispora thermophila TaxID=265470 RepID=UPI000382426B|nr:DUF1659 domain-containing protein [Desulfurispora thermophila]
MPVTRVATGSALRLVLQTGVDEQGNPITRNKTLSNVKTSASDEDVYAVAALLAGLQDYGVNNILRIDSGALQNS